jgi:hypothetical protein
MRVWVWSKILTDSAEDLTSGMNLLNYTIAVRTRTQEETRMDIRKTYSN